MTISPRFLEDCIRLNALPEYAIFCIQSAVFILTLESL